MESSRNPLSNSCSGFRNARFSQITFCTDCHFPLKTTLIFAFIHCLWFSLRMLLVRVQMVKLNRKCILAEWQGPLRNPTDNLFWTQRRKFNYRLFTEFDFSLLEIWQAELTASSRAVPVGRSQTWARDVVTAPGPSSGEGEGGEGVRSSRRPEVLGQEGTG